MARKARGSTGIGAIAGGVIGQAVGVPYPVGAAIGGIGEGVLTAEKTQAAPRQSYPRRQRLTYLEIVLANEIYKEGKSYGSKKTKSLKSKGRKQSK